MKEKKMINHDYWIDILQECKRLIVSIGIMNLFINIYKKAKQFNA